MTHRSHFTVLHFMLFTFCLMLAGAALAHGNEQAAFLLADVSPARPDGAMIMEPAPQPLMGQVLQGLAGLVGTVLLALMSVGGMALRAWLSTQAWGGAVAGLETKVEALVHHAEAELRPVIQKALADGTLDGAEKADIKRQVLALLKQSAQGELKVLTERFGFFGAPLENFLSGLIEKAVAKMNAPQPIEKLS